jgi:hypothetical protein
MEIGYVVRDAKNWEVEPKSSASEFDAEYYGKLLEKAWAEVAFVFNSEKPKKWASHKGSSGDRCIAFAPRPEGDETQVQGELWTLAKWDRDQHKSDEIFNLRMEKV